MNDINIKDLKINIELATLLNAIDSKNSFDIDVDGNVYINNTIPKNKAVIFKAQAQDASGLFDLQTRVKNLFGKDYKPQIVGSQCIISPLASWMHVLDLNKDTMLYFDHQSDGVEYFEHSDIEDIGWNAAPLDIKYREICDFIEKNCEGTFLFYDNGMHFNGFVVPNNIEEVKTKLTVFVKELLENKIKNDEINVNELDDEETESFEFFGLK